MSKILDIPPFQHTLTVPPVPQWEEREPLLEGRRQLEREWQWQEHPVGKELRVWRQANGIT